jgi:HK97 family phage major capsid protein
MTVEEILTAMRAIIDGATTEDGAERDLSEEESQRYETLEGQLKAARRSAELRARQSAYETPVNHMPNVRVGGGNRREDTLERAFNHYLRTGRENQDITELRAQSVGTDSAGGYLVPDVMRDKIVERLKAFGGLAGAVEEITTSGGELLRWPTLDDTANAGVIAAEGTAPASGGADLVFGEKTLGAFKYVAPGASNLPLRVSVELLQDSHFDIQGLVTRKLGERIARAQAVHWVTGNGTTEPFGIDTGTSGTAFTSAGITYAELVAAVHEIDPAYRANASWSFNDATMAKIESIVDTTGRPILNTSTDGIATGPSNARLLGYPVVIDQAFPTYTDGGTNKWGVFGDLRAAYVIRRVKDLTLIVNPYSRANEGQVEYTLWARADGTVQDTNAYRVLINAV